MVSRAGYTGHPPWGDARVEFDPGKGVGGNAPGKAAADHQVFAGRDRPQLQRLRLYQQHLYTGAVLTKGVGEYLAVGEGLVGKQYAQRVVHVISMCLPNSGGIQQMRYLFEPSPKN